MLFREGERFKESSGRNGISDNDIQICNSRNGAWEEIDSKAIAQGDAILGAWLPAAEGREMEDKPERGLIEEAQAEVKEVTVAEADTPRG